MRINRKLQYGLLFSIYLSRSGRSTVDIVSKNIDVPKDFLEQIARELRLGGVVKSVRGPNGGYELFGDPTIGDIFRALNEISLMSAHEITAYRRGELEHRALAGMVADMAFSLHPVLRRSVRDVVRDLVSAENYLTDQAKASMRSN